MKFEHYIVKSWESQYPQLALNEYFCMSAIKNAGLHTAEFYLSDDLSMFVMKRFDVKDDENQANLFFQVINKKYEIGSIIITSNLSFTKWKEVLNNDEALTAAVLDRLIHHSHLINVTGESYRLKQKKGSWIVRYF